jgi:carbon-monoxide dehydrogenase medium subunit
LTFRPKEYFNPSSLREVLSLLGEFGDGAKPLAGGTDLLVDRPLDLEYIVDISGLPLDYIKVSEKGVKIGALTTFRSIETSKLLRDGPFSILVEAAREMGSVPIRNVATVGGNICNALHSAELPPALVALDAKVKLAGLGGERILPLEEFFLGVRKTALKSSELLTEIQVPRPPPRTGTAFLNISRTAVDLSMVVVAVRVTLQADGCCGTARIVVGGGVGPTVIKSDSCKLLEGEKVLDELIEKAAAATAEELKPRPTSIRGSPFYKTEVTKVLVRRALKQAFENAGGAC